MSLVDLLPGEHATGVRDHWWWRPGWRIGRRFYAFHITFENRAELQRLADGYRQCLANVPTVTLVPDNWLHLTMQGIDFTDELSLSEVQHIARRTGEDLAEVPVFDVTFEDIVVADEAIVMPAEPAEPIRHLRAVVRNAIAQVLGESRVTEDAQRFRPHVSVAYIAAEGRAEPYIDAVKAAQLEPARVRIDHVDLIEMHRDHRMYEWSTVAAMPLR
jgi:2'-5' RNA ligase